MQIHKFIAHSHWRQCCIFLHWKMSVSGYKSSLTYLKVNLILYLPAFRPITATERLPHMLVIFELNHCNSPQMELKALRIAITQLSDCGFHCLVQVTIFCNLFLLLYSINARHTVFFPPVHWNDVMVIWGLVADILFQRDYTDRNTVWRHLFNSEIAIGYANVVHSNDSSVIIMFILGWLVKHYH